ncbi:phosphomevalonate kinase [Strigomonas culicis]|uniref:phosphomevalonate kinase n=1 Tax=Strigomonas culicis TaxID=28005 RepID=S9V7W2_9TRYP|nr:phosphomevalonate kinase [Strigomonas culicis]|eukprot:EPY19045.1 phosphomevalonate kinase [Strigomonas culicis]
MPVNTANLRQLPKHLPLVGDVSKTGLGSSAAMTTSVVACIYAFFARQHTDKEFIHRIAQVAHSVAQGKIGSGFDVFTAVYGTCAYRRFPAEKVETMLKGVEAPQRVAVAQLTACVDMREAWVENVPFHLPRGIKLVLGDVHQGGSSTPGMVAKIMAWQKANASTPDNLWSKLRENNESYIEALRALIKQAEEQPEAHTAAVEALSAVRHLPDAAPQDAAARLVVAAAQCAALSRTYLRELGVAAGVKVEPEELSGLLNDTAALPGVFAVGCPGAGGYDAVFALVLGDANCDAVEAFWRATRG